MATSTANEPLISFAASKVVAHRGDLHVDVTLNLSAVASQEVDAEVHVLKDKNAPVGQVAESRSDYVPTLGTVKDANSQVGYYPVKFAAGKTQATVRILLEANEIPLSKPIYFAAKVSKPTTGVAKIDSTKNTIEIEIDPANTTPTHTVAINPTSLSISGKTAFNINIPGSGSTTITWYKNGAAITGTGGSSTQTLPFNLNTTADVFGGAPFNGPGTYALMASFSDGTTATSANLTVTA